MNHWLIKSEPKAYSWDDLVRLGRDMWDGVRNFQARNNLKAMKEGDLALFYHSVNEKSVVGVARVVKEFYPDPTADDNKWVVVDFVPVEKLKRPVSLEEIKAEPRLEGIVLTRNSRLSVQPVEKAHFDVILEMGST